MTRIVGGFARIFSGVVTVREVAFDHVNEVVQALVRALETLVTLTRQFFHHPLGSE